jgi:hypothetical protein
MKYYRSVRLDGFNDNIYMPMWRTGTSADHQMKDDERYINNGDSTQFEEHIHNGIDLCKTTVYEFIVQNYKTAAGVKILDLVFPPILGVLEVLINKDQIAEGSCVTKLLMGDLANLMSDNAIATTFQNPQEVITKGLAQERWQPFYLTALVPESEKQQFHSSTYTYKKRRTASPIHPKPIVNNPYQPRRTSTPN